jgi:hypothetical protein
MVEEPVGQRDGTDAVGDGVVEPEHDRRTDRRSGQLRWGIESIAKVLGIAPSTYHAARSRSPSARAVRDTELKPEILRVWEQNLSV